MNSRQKDNVRSYFDNISGEYTCVSDGKAGDSVRSYIFSSRKKYVMDMVALKGGRVLDIGCGPAVLTEKLLRNSCEVWGIDISEKMVEEAKKRMIDRGFNGRYHFNTGDIERLDFPDAYFDSVLCIGVLEYLKEDSKALNEIRRVLKDRGELIISVPNMASPFVLFDKIALFIARRFLMSKVEISPNRLSFRQDIIVKQYLPWRFNRLLKDNGFEINKTICHAVRSSFLNLILPRLALFFIKRLEFLTISPLRWMGINYIVKASKVDNLKGIEVK